MEWLPDLICCDGQWADTLARVYEVFTNDFLYGPCTCLGIQVRLREAPTIGGKDRTFWHLISEGEDSGEEADRIADFKRCARMGWVRAILDNSADGRLNKWEQLREGKRNQLIALPDFSYVVVLGRRSGRNGVYFVLLTAFCPNERKQRKFAAECREFNGRRGV